eukprot:5634775-Alexandrium_andersonii.AAC.1
MAWGSRSSRRRNAGKRWPGKRKSSKAQHGRASVAALAEFWNYKGTAWELRDDPEVRNAAGAVGALG